MRVLKFIVNGLTVEPDPSCDFSGLFPAPNQEIVAEFQFSNEWYGMPKVAAFYSMLDKEYPPQVISEEYCCMIPKEALNRPTFRLQILGNNRGIPVSTNTLTIYQKGGKV